jgi:hypothetical protein
MAAHLLYQQKASGNPKEGKMLDATKYENGRVGYLILYFMGVPIGLLLVMWVVLGNNIFGPG